MLTSERAVQAARAPDGERVPFRIGPNTPGLELRVSGPVKSWSLRYRLKGGTQRRVTIGSYPAVSLAAARIRTKEIAAAAARPAEDQRKREEERKAASRPKTVGNLLDEYVERHCKHEQRKWHMTERLFEMHVKPTLRKKPLIELRRADLVELLDDLQNEKGLRAQVNRVRSQVLAALNWAVEHEYLDTNPAAAIKKRKIETSRDRVLSGSELRAILRWADAHATDAHPADALSDPSRSLVKAWVLTAQRRDEVRCLNWSEVDLGRVIWTLPAARNKGKRDHEIPLTPPVVKLLGEPRPGESVFTVNREKPYAGQRRLKEILDRESGVTGWTFHDFRRTAATGMAALGVGQDVIDRVLGHSNGTLAGTYNRHDYAAAKRQALSIWADHVAAIAAGGPAAWDEVRQHPSSRTMPLEL
jgi:integrase